MRIDRYIDVGVCVNECMFYTVLSVCDAFYFFTTKSYCVNMAHCIFPKSKAVPTITIETVRKHARDMFRLQLVFAGGEGGGGGVL